MTVYGYLFKELEGTDEISCSRQRELVEQYAQVKGCVVDGRWFEDKALAGRQDFSERQGGRELLACCRSGDMIIAASVSFVFSNARAGMRLVDFCRTQGISFHLVDLNGDIALPEKRNLVISNGISETVIALLRCLAVKEDSGHGAAISCAKQKMLQKGLYLGGPVAFGWKVSERGVLVQNEQQQRIIKHMINMRSDRWSYRDISSILKEKYDVQLSHEGVRKVLEGNKLKKGLRELPKNNLPD
ncbi:MAG: recombinase family protein [Desulfobulbaceae bacterium]|nr:recombinase family protein [Desulfobulbaceae bacterium]